MEWTLHCSMELSIVRGFFGQHSAHIGNERHGSEDSLFSSQEIPISAIYPLRQALGFKQPRLLSGESHLGISKWITATGNQNLGHPNNRFYSLKYRMLACSHANSDTSTRRKPLLQETQCVLLEFHDEAYSNPYHGDQQREVILFSLQTYSN
jgi:hypothetical protein